MGSHLRCLIPRFNGAILSLEWKAAVWDRSVTGAPRPRTPSEQQYSDRGSSVARPCAPRKRRSSWQRRAAPRASDRDRDDHARRQSSNTAIASFARDAEPRVGDQPQDSGEVAQTGDGRGFEDRAERPSLHNPDRSRRGGGRCVPASHAATGG